MTGAHRRMVLACLWVVALVSAPLAIARADSDPCEWELLDPIGGSLRDSGLDVPASACVRDRLDTSARGLVLIDAPNFYGTLSASGFAAIRDQALPGVELSVGARVVDYRFAQNAVLPADEVTFGPVFVSGMRSTRSTWFSRPVAIGHGLRLELPRTDSSAGATVVAAAPSLLFTMAASRRLSVHGQLAALLWSALAEAGPDTRAALTGRLSAAYALTDWLAGALGVDAQGGWYGLGLDHVAGSAGARFQLGCGLAATASVVAPVVGSERIDLAAAVGLEIGW